MRNFIAPFLLIRNVDFERNFRRNVVAIGATAFVLGLLSIVLGANVTLSGQLIVVAVVLAIIAFVCIAASGFQEAYRQIRGEHPQT